MDPSQTKITSFTKIKKKIVFSDTKIVEKNGVTRTKQNNDSLNNQSKTSTTGLENEVIVID